MFVGREAELAALERLYAQNRFQMVVVYGRRRVGKTTLIAEFARGRRTVAFTAQMQSPHENLRGFSKAVYVGLGLPQGGTFETWPDALSFMAEQSKALDEPLVVLFDEFPYAAEGEPSLPSALQVTIDQQLLGTNVFLVLCGSNESFMEGEVLGAKSPLFGRRTAQIHLGPFDYVDVSRMLPHLGPIDLIQAYATFGGVPYYIAQVDDTASWQDNVSALMFNPAGLLYEEPLMFLRQELREPALYNSIIGAVARGATRQKAIGEAAGIEPSHLGPYLKTLKGLGIIERRAPFGEDPARSRRGVWRVMDPYFAFWYRFVRPAIPAIEMGAGEMAAREIASSDSLPTYVGKRFEDVCMQWVARANARGELPFLATSFGQWWGTDPAAREQADIDLLAASQEAGALIAGECKWRNSFDETKALRTLEARANLVPGKWQKRTYALFSKHPLGEGMLNEVARRDDLVLVDASAMFR